MVKLKRLTHPTDKFLHIIPPVTSTELQEREKDYPLLTPSRMTLKSNEQLYRPTELTWKEQLFKIQVNHCSNPFCKNHGLPQKRFDVKSKPYRYKITGKSDSKMIFCNPDHSDPDGIPTLSCNTSTMSNWSLAEEIERLIRINSVLPIDPVYNFHKDDCLNSGETPFVNVKSFYKRGKSSSNSQRYQCKTCKKFTNVLPSKSENTTYNQKRNDIIPQFANMLINRVPVASTCKILNIGRKTYYTKLEWLYRCCLEFLETRETKALENVEFEKMWLNTDMMMYVLNNVRRKGLGKAKTGRTHDKQLPTQTVVTADHHTRYVFRSDIAFDFDITFKQIEEDTNKYKDDHLNNFLSKNARFTRYYAFPMKPTPKDNESLSTYKAKMREVNIRQDYVDGLHANHTYTAMAQLWLIKNQVKAKKWRITTDDDAILKTAFSRIFKDEINQKKAYHFIIKFDKKLSREDSFKEYLNSIDDLKDWAERNKIDYSTLYEAAKIYLEEQLKHHSFHRTLHTPAGEVYREYDKNPIEHPIGMMDRGSRMIDVVTDMSHLDNEALANLLLGVNDNAVNSFLQEIRRSLSVLERPLVTSRGDGKSYIYSNFNPRYAQMAITILRTYYNFCKPYKTKGRNETPAQRLGIADRVYTWKDIIYKR